MARQARRGWSRRAVVVGVAYAGCLTLFVLANRLTTAANTIYLQSTAPLYLPLLAPWLLKEPTRRQDVGFMVAVGLGLTLFFVGVERRGDGAGSGAGESPGGGSGLFWALTVLVCAGYAPGRGAGPQRGGHVGKPHRLSGRAAVCPPAGRHSYRLGLVAYLGVFQIALAYMLVTSAIATFLPWKPRSSC